MAMMYPPLTARLATVVHRLGLAKADDDALRTAVDRAVTPTFDNRPWIGPLLDSVLAGRTTDEPVPCPGGPDGLVAVLLEVTTSDGGSLWMDRDGDRWRWVMPRLNLVLSLGPTDYTITTWVAAFPRLTTGLATILYGLGLAGDDDAALRADVHEAVWVRFGDREPPAWMGAVVDGIIYGRFDYRPVPILAGGAVLLNILTELQQRFAVSLHFDDGWWSWSLPAFGACLFVDGGRYTITPLDPR